MDNGAVDTLSRNDAATFLVQVSSTRQRPIETPVTDAGGSEARLDIQKLVCEYFTKGRRGGHIRQGRGVTSHFGEMGGLWESQQWRRCCAG